MVPLFYVRRHMDFVRKGQRFIQTDYLACLESGQLHYVPTIERAAMFSEESAAAYVARPTRRVIFTAIPINQG